MARYFIDTEFLEGAQQKRFFGKTKPTIDLISIGIVCEDGREYSAVSKDFNLREAWNRFDWKEHKATHKKDEGKVLYQKVYWIRENVLKPVYYDLCLEYYKDFYSKHKVRKIRKTRFDYRTLKFLIRKYGKSNAQIAHEIYDFVNPDLGFHISAYSNSELKNPESDLSYHFEKHDVDMVDEVYIARPTFYGYYSAYDHVVFCWLFGKMIDLPKGFPMYTCDLKQMLDEKLLSLDGRLTNVNGKNFTWKGKTLQERLDFVKLYPTYPKQMNTHNALADARWNKELHEFIEKL